MTGIKLDIFIGPDILGEIILFEELYPHLNIITKRHAVIYLDITEKEFDEQLDNPDSEIGLLSRYDVEIRPAKTFFEKIKQDKGILLNKARAVYILNISKEEAEELTNEYGTIVISQNYINDNIFQLSFKKQVEDEESFREETNGWRSILSRLHLPPSNSLIITDNYLLNNIENEQLIGIENLKMLLNELLPGNLSTSFQILIMTHMPAHINAKRANRINGELKAYLNSIRPYEINLEFVFDKTIHPRKIISNYYVLTCDKGFQLFSIKDKCKSRTDNLILIQSILHDPLNTTGDTELYITFKDIKKIRDICEKLKETIISGNTIDHKRKIIGDTRPDKTIINRLVH